jgi:hypothetical protein
LQKSHSLFSRLPFVPKEGIRVTDSLALLRKKSIGYAAKTAPNCDGAPDPIPLGAAGGLDTPFKMLYNQQRDGLRGWLSVMKEV